MSRFTSGGVAYEYEGELDEFTKLTATRPGWPEPKVMSLATAISMTNGAILEDLDDQPTGGVESTASGGTE